MQVLVDGPLTGVPRQEYRLNNLHLTKYRIKFPFTAPTRIVRKAWVDSDLKAQWKVSPWSVKAQNICKVCKEYSTKGGIRSFLVLHMMIIESS